MRLLLPSGSDSWSEGDSVVLAAVLVKVADSAKLAVTVVGNTTGASLTPCTWMVRVCTRLAAVLAAPLLSVTVMWKLRWPVAKSSSPLRKTTFCNTWR